MVMASDAGRLDLHLWSHLTLNSDAEDVLGLYRNLHPLRFNHRHIYWNEQKSHLLVFLHLGQHGSWTLCKWQGPRGASSTLTKLVARCRRGIKATYQTLRVRRSLWHGGAGKVRALVLPAGKQFFFNSTGNFQEILTEFAAAPDVIQKRLGLLSSRARTTMADPSFFMADLSRMVGWMDRPPLNLWTLGTYFYHVAHAQVPGSPCWGGGYMPQMCCHARISPEKLSWCFGRIEGDMVEHCCARYLEHPPVGRVEMPPVRPLFSRISVQIFLQSYNEDRFALLPFLESVERFWPKDWKSRVFVAVDNVTADHQMCEALSSRVTCVVTESIPRGPSVIDSIEWSGRGVSERYHKLLLQYHYWLADIYIAQHVKMPDWIAWFDADVVIHTPRVEELLMPFGLPVHFARRSMQNSMETMSLGLDWVGEFMDTFPQLVRPSHLQHFRAFVKKMFNKDSFEEAYHAWRQSIEEAALVHGKFYGYLSEAEGPQSSFPVFLYHFHHEEFTWALEDAAAFGLPLEDSCLSFRVASHVSQWKHKVRESNWTEAAYAQRARRLMQLGQRNSRVLRIALLSANFNPEGTWSQRSSAHCIERDRETMLWRFFQQRKLL
ncbi:unnamed protein product [Durusdinium trenchii]|uniref:Mitochondrial n=3 Tax=Durusdinium trenchii TaxID=1381693 RepID=A0ABP0L0C2_9DINO